MIERVCHKKLMGTAFSLGVLAETEKQAEIWLNEGISEIQRIETLLSEYIPNSETSRINNAPSCKEITIDDEVFHLIKRCRDISELTEGYFDISSGQLKKLYSFSKDEESLPSDKDIAETRQSVGSKLLLLDSTKNSVKKLAPKLHISFNAIGKGYAADAVKKLWVDNGVSSGFINASGDLSVFGQKNDNSPWHVAIADPNDSSRPLLYLPLFNQSIATSGDSEQFFTHKGKKYSHNINPLTGKPVEGIKSVSIISPSAELSDALATAIYTMGKKRGLDFVNQLPHTYAIIIDNSNHVSLSKKLNYEAITR